LKYRTTFLLPDSFQADGVVFAFAAYYRNSNPVRFQLWRPVDTTTENVAGVERTDAQAPSSSSETSVQLLSQITVTPSIRAARETVCYYSNAVLVSLLCYIMRRTLDFSYLKCERFFCLRFFRLTVFLSSFSFRFFLSIF